MNVLIWIRKKILKKKISGFDQKGLKQSREKHSGEMTIEKSLANHALNEKKFIKVKNNKKMSYKNYDQLDTSEFVLQQKKTK